jgi:hypothetical protein
MYSRLWQNKAEWDTAVSHMSSFGSDTSDNKSESNYGSDSKLAQPQMSELSGHKHIGYHVA